MESCSRPMAVCSAVDGRFWVHLQLVKVQLRGVGFCGGDEESIISLSNREWHWWRLWEEEAEAGEHAASLVAVLHSTRAAPVMDWRQLEGGSPESIKVSSWNRVCVCEGGIFCKVGNLIKSVFTFKPHNLMANNGLKLQWFVVTKKTEITLSASPHPHQAFFELRWSLKIPKPSTFPVMTRSLNSVVGKNTVSATSPSFSPASHCPLIGR